MGEEARKLYLNDPLLSDHKKKVKGSFVAPNYTDHDFAFRFRHESKDSVGSGHAHPITIGSATVYGDELAADDSSYVVDMKQELVKRQLRYTPPRPSGGLGASQEHVVRGRPRSAPNHSRGRL
jgi:hypothetical protein